MSHRFLSILMVLVALCGCSGSGSGGYAESPESADRTSLRGTWDIVSVEGKGKMGSGRYDRAVFRDTMLDIYEESNKAAPKYLFGTKLDDTKQPKWIDGRNGERANDALGLYELKGDELTIVFNDAAKSPADRPTEFKASQSNPDVAVFHLKRRKS